MFFFFFQAEDGIRDKLVTGVQTCALPISPPEGTEERVALIGVERGPDVEEAHARASGNEPFERLEREARALHHSDAGGGGGKGTGPRGGPAGGGGEGGRPVEQGGVGEGEEPGPGGG